MLITHILYLSIIWLFLSIIVLSSKIVAFFCTPHPLNFLFSAFATAHEDI